MLRFSIQYMTLIRDFTDMSVRWKASDNLINKAFIFTLLFGFAVSFNFVNPYTRENVEANSINTKNDNSLYAETSLEFQAKAKQQANKIIKDPDAPRKSNDAEYVASKKNNTWIPFWYDWSIIKHNNIKKMPLNHPENVRTSKNNVLRYQHYVNQTRSQTAPKPNIYIDTSGTFLMILIIILIFIF